MITVKNPGMQTTVQDRGRIGYQNASLRQARGCKIIHPGEHPLGNTHNEAGGGCVHRSDPSV